MSDDDFSEPAYDIEAERTVLAAMLLHPSAVEAAARVLIPDHFYRPAHQVMFATLTTMTTEGAKVDPVLLTARMREDGNHRLLGADGLYVAGLAGLKVVPGWAETYARVVLKLAVQRQVTSLGSQMISLGRAGDLDETDLVTRGHALLDEVLTCGAGSAADMPGVTADEFCDSEEVKAEPLIPNLLYQMERVITVGPEGSGKSILALQVAFTAASGIHPFRHTEEFDPVKVLVVDLENPPHILQRRFRTFRSIAQECAGWDGKNVTLLHRPGGLNLTNSRDAYGLAQLVKRSGAKFVVAGPIYKMMSGVKVDLDTYTELGDFWDKLREDCGITLWMEAHAPYGGGFKREMRPEGSNLWAKWCEFGVSLNWAVKKHDGAHGGLDWTYFKGQREEGRGWPSWITRNRIPGRGWPWLANFDPSAFRVPLGQEPEPEGDDGDGWPAGSHGGSVNGSTR